DNSYQGAGKSTLVTCFSESHMMKESCTQICGEAEMTIDGKKYTLVDTPGIFDTQKPNEEALTKLHEQFIHVLTVSKLSFLFLKQSSLPKNKRMAWKQNENRDEMRKTWNQTVSSFIRSLGGRWGISPNSDYFPPESSVHKARLTEIKDFIASTRGVYTTEVFESARQEQEKNRREWEENEKNTKKEYEEKLRQEGKAKADEFYKKGFAKMQEEFKKNEANSLAKTLNSITETYERSFNLLKSAIELEKRRNDSLKSEIDSEKHAHELLKSEFDRLKSAKSVQIHDNNKIADLVPPEIMVG
ncbi:13123_t:CDS:2, partial [Ambispora leptoticha]